MLGENVKLMARKGFKKIVIISEVERLLDHGYTDKNLIIEKVMQKYKVDRPTVRRTIRDMRSEMQKKIKILQSDYYPPPE